MAHPLVGSLKQRSSTRTKPTRSYTSRSDAPTSSERSSASPAAVMSRNHRAMGDAGSSVPSSQPRMLSTSCDSNQPPGSSASKACRATCCSNEDQQPDVARVWM